MVEWQPIETAPRDGSHVLVVMHDGSVGFGWFGGRNVPMQTVAHWWSNPGEEGWYPSVGAGDADPLSPTHWKPLDEPDEGPPDIFDLVHAGSTAVAALHRIKEIVEADRYDGTPRTRDEASTGAEKELVSLLEEIWGAAHDALEAIKPNGS
jgi:hypothetical protein